MQIILDQFPDLNEKQINQLSRLKNIYETWNNKINVISERILKIFTLDIYFILCP